jgi:hypothetical protein
VKNVADKRPVVDTSARALAIIITVLLVGAPVVLLLMAYNVLTPNDVNSTTGYSDTLQALDGLRGSALTGGRIWFGVISAFIAALALALLFLLLFLRPRSKEAVVQSEPGRETVLKPKAMRHLAEGAAREAGARDPTVEMSVRRGGYDVSCGFRITEFNRVAELAERVRDRIRSELTDAGVNVRRVEATVQEPAPSEAERDRVL